MAKSLVSCFFYSRCRKVKSIWILLKQETVSGSGISWAACNSAPRSRHNHASTPPLNSVKVLKAPNAGSCSNNRLTYCKWFQVVLNDDQSTEEGKQIADDLMTKLEIDSSDLLSGAYMDLLLAKDTCNCEHNS